MKAEEENKAKQAIKMQAENMAKQQQKEIRNKESKEIEDLNKDLNDLAQIEKNKISSSKDKDDDADLMKGMEEL